MMVRSTTTTAALLLFAVVAISEITSSVSGYSIVPSLTQQRASYFVGRDVLASTSRGTTRACTTIEMKKGKANIPSHMRSQYARAQEMEGMRKQMMESTTVGSDGMPIFNLYVRTSLKNVSSSCCSRSLLIECNWFCSVVEDAFVGSNWVVFEDFCFSVFRKKTFIYVTILAHTLSSCCIILSNHNSKIPLDVVSLRLLQG